MKKLVISIIVVLFSSILFISCKKNEDTQENTVKSNDVKQFPKNLKIIDGKLSFESYSDFQSALDYFSDTEFHHVSDEQFLAWEKENNFESLRGNLIRLENAIAEANSTNEIEAIKKLNPQFNYDENNIPSLKKESNIKASLLSNDRKVFINGLLYFYGEKYQIIVKDGKETTLQKALKMNKSDTINGIFVFERYMEINDRVANCGTSRSCEKTSDGKRVRGKWWLGMAYFFENNPNSGSIVSTRCELTFFSEIESWKKVAGIYVKNHNDDIKWNTGYGINYQLYEKDILSFPPFLGYVQKTYNHGTGWTQNSWRIYYTHTLYSGFPPTDLAGSPYFNPQPYFYYIGCNAENLNKPACRCNDDCF